MSRTLHLDTNVVLRYLLNDHPEMSSASARLFESAEAGEVELHLDPLVLAECCYVLGGTVYAFDRFDIAQVLTQLLLLDGVVTNDAMRLTETLSVYAEKNVDFTDAYLSTGIRQHFDGIASFDQNFNRLGAAVHAPI